jgi:hypothetical protein
LLERVYVLVAARVGPDRFCECAAKRSGDLVVGCRSELATADHDVRTGIVAVPPRSASDYIGRLISGSVAFRPAGADCAATH